MSGSQLQQDEASPALQEALIGHQDSDESDASHSCCKNRRNTLVACISAAQTLSAVFFVVSALPYFIDFKSCVHQLYPTIQHLQLYETIWIRVHVVAGTLNLALGPVQVIYGILKSAQSPVHKVLGYIYSVAMVFNVSSSIPLVVIRFMEGGTWLATPLLFLTSYAATTLTLGIWAVTLSNNKPRHRRMLFRNYFGVFTFVTFRIGGILGGFHSPLPTVFMLLTVITAEWIIQACPNTFEDAVGHSEAE